MAATSAEPAGDPPAGLESLSRLSSAEAPLFLSPSLELSLHARAASRHLFSSLLAYCPKKTRPPLDRLLADESFDAEQIWAQIDLLSRPVVSAVRNELGRIVQRPTVAKAVSAPSVAKEEVHEDEDEDEEGEKEEGDDDDDGDEEEEEEEEEEGNGVEDRFLKIRDLEKYIEDGEAREYGDVTGNKKMKEEDDDNDDDDEEEGDGEEGGEIDLQV